MASNETDLGELAKLKQESAVVRELEVQMHVLNLRPWVREFRFHPKRRWLFDISFPRLMIAVEVDGATWAGGHHTRGQGYEDDCEKCNEAALLGWRVYRFTSGMVHNGQAVRTISLALGQEGREEC